MSEITKVTYKIKNLSDAPISFVGLHTLSIPGTSEAEYTLSENAWKKLLPRIRSKKTLVVTKVSDTASRAAASETSTTSTATASTYSTSTKTSAKATKSSSKDTTTSSSTTTASTDATTSTKEG